MAWRPNKHQKVMLYFDLKRGVWIGNTATMRAAIKKGLRKAGMNSGRAFLNNMFVLSLEDVQKESQKKGKQSASKRSRA